MTNAVKETIEATDKKIAFNADYIRRTICRSDTMTEKTNKIIVENITKYCNNIQNLLKVRTTLLKY